MLKTIGWAIALSFMLSSCGLIYRIDVQQGNLVTDELLSQLKLGMTTQKVRYVMGNPLIKSVFHQKGDEERWDYYYSFREGWNKPETRQITLIFEKNTLMRMEGETNVKLKAPDSPIGLDIDRPIL
jgi:outer membrane protein assembly factor BamE